MSQRRSVLQMLYNNFRKSIRRPPPPQQVGEDHLGNKYFEFIPDEYYSHRRKQRSVKPVDTSIDYELPFEWEAWLRGRRRDPPTQQEIDERMERQAQAIANARRVDQGFTKKPEVRPPTAFPKLADYSSQASGPIIRKKDTIDE